MRKLIPKLIKGKRSTLASLILKTPLALLSKTDRALETFGHKSSILKGNTRQNEVGLYNEI